MAFLKNAKMVRAGLPNSQSGNCEIKRWHFFLLFGCDKKTH